MSLKNRNAIIPLVKEQGRSNDGGYLNHIPIISGIKRQFDNDIGEMGVQQAFAKWVAIAGEGKLSIRGKDDHVKEILREKPVVVVANHPFFAEIFTVIASLEPRDDMYGVGISNFLGIGPNISRHVFPIYMTRQMSSERQKLLVRAGHMLHFGPRIPPDEAHKKNVESIHQAAEAVRNGSLVFMMPEGVKSGKAVRWSSGIGHLLLGIGENTNAYLLFAYSEGTSNWDYLRIVPGVKKILPTVSITFAKPITIADALGESTDPREITRKLQEEYNNWVRSIGKGL